MSQLYNYNINIEEDIKQVEEIHNNLWIIFKDESIKELLKELLMDGYYTPRWLDRTLPNQKYHIREAEKNGRDTIQVFKKQEQVNWSLFVNNEYRDGMVFEDELYKVIVPDVMTSKFTSMNNYARELLSILPDHANTTWHTKKLIQYTRDYKFTNNQKRCYYFDMVIFLHDLLSETRLRDVTQREGKTDHFRVKEKYAARYNFNRLYNTNSISFNNTNAIIRNMQDFEDILKKLENKTSWIYKTLKVYEAFSDIDWLLALHQWWFLKKWQESFEEKMKETVDKIQKQIDKYPFIQKFLNDRNWEIEKFIDHYTTPNNQWSLFDNK